MTGDDLARIEAELGLQLPSDYRAMMLSYPQSLWEAFPNSPPGSQPPEVLLFADPDRVILYNRDWREDDFLLGEDDTEPRPDRYLIIGEDGGGGCWCVKLGCDDGGVWYFDHVDGSLVPSASCDGHVQNLLRYLTRERLR